MYTQGIYNRPGIKCINGHHEIASQIIDRFYLGDFIFAEFFLQKLYIFRSCWYLTSDCFYCLKEDSELGIHSSFRQTSPWLDL